MLQRNVSGSPLVLPTLEPPAEVLPGDTIEYDEPLAGFEVVGDQQTEVAEPVAVTNILNSLPPLGDKKLAAPSAATDEEATE